MVAVAIDKADMPARDKVIGLLSRLAEEIPKTVRSPRFEDWEDVELDLDEESPATERSPDLQVRSKLFVSDMEAGVKALAEIIQGGVEGRESDMRGELELVSKGAEGLEMLL